jgi:DNA-nicking Smr family endonuclease
MARRGRSIDDPGGASHLNAPFRDLRKKWRPAPAPPPKQPVAVRPAASDTDLFASAMADVIPLPRGGGRVDGPAPSHAPRRPVSEEAEALAELSDLVTGVTRFDVTDTREYVEGVVVGLDPRLVRRLRRGDFAWQAHIDLHGLTATVARETVDRFVLESFRTGLTPVLKERLKSWLAHGRTAKVVLAFATARPCDGGAGALYVLLRRDRRAQPIRVTEGAKR